LNPRKDTFLFGARPTPRQAASLPFRIALVQAPFIVLFCILLGPGALVWLGAVLAVNAIYNWPRLGFKNWPALDMLSQTGYLLVFVLSSWLNGVPQLPWFTFVFGALFAMHSHLFGQIMDYLPDRAAGRCTTAGALGVVPAKWLVSALLCIEAGLVWQCTRDPWMSAALVTGAVFFAADATLLWRARPYTPGRMQFFFLGWNAVCVLSIPWVWWTATLAGGSSNPPH
ncbi:MAG: hypothetical protein M3463_22865, partial [Verrucomicrobiota bacterium]|nr:hypothetical protein [Verrucomicrobiota bacterium]